jgi:acyl-CoA synthetase (AMP-forming)/AMP-acid ligase II
MSWADDVTAVTDFVRVQARERPDATAFWFEDRETSFTELDARSSQCAQALLAAGAQPGERVASLCKNTDAFPVLWFGAMKARACVVPVNSRLAPPEIAAIVRDSGAAVLVFGQEFAGVVEGMAGECPDLRTLVRFEPGHAELPGFDAWIGAFPAADPRLVAGLADDVIQLYTSGTTGLPKGVSLTHANCLSQCRIGRELRYGQWEAGKSALLALPVFHVAGAIVAMLAVAGRPRGDGARDQPRGGCPGHRRAARRLCIPDADGDPDDPGCAGSGGR